LATIFLFLFKFPLPSKTFLLPPCPNADPASLLPINDEDRNDTHIASTSRRLY